ncbi:mas-related G-protein coupled receptor member X1-like [Gracilinanus agilis]|uniref:mas-related G-protein coupled receptor member X1-like n=1 Tax=Gracilinanus agilis TaxID=191870 RepID=UPI001CFD690E|nr:mas-related G-protein coupled receptor member X1-like [Gracilinanus agilis]
MASALCTVPAALAGPQKRGSRAEETLPSGVLNWRTFLENYLMPFPVFMSPPGHLRGEGFLQLPLSTMAASSTPGQPEYGPDNATETVSNGTLAEESFGDAAFRKWRKILTLVVVPVGLVGNSLVLWLLGFRIQRNRFSVYILNLAGADALFLGSFLVFFLWEIGKTPLLCLLEECMLYMFYCVGLGLLAAISTERCLSVLFPIWYRCHRPKHASAAVCALLWALALLFWGGYFGFCFYTDCLHFWDDIGYLLAAWFIPLTPVLCGSSLTLVLKVQCSSQRRQPPRLYLLVLLTVLVFLLCAVPLGVMIFLWSLAMPNFRLFRLSLLLACVNSSANPFIYFFLGSRRCRRGREPLRVILQRALGEEQESGVGKRDTSHTQTLDTSSRGEERDAQGK